MADKNLEMRVNLAAAIQDFLGPIQQAAEGLRAMGKDVQQVATAFSMAMTETSAVAVGSLQQVGEAGAEAAGVMGDDFKEAAEELEAEVVESAEAAGKALGEDLAGGAKKARDEFGRFLPRVKSTAPALGAGVTAPAKEAGRSLSQTLRDGVRAAMQWLRDLQARTRESLGSFDDLTKKIGEVGQNLKRSSRQFAIYGAAMMAPFAAATASATSFQSGLAKSAALGVKDLKSLGNGLQELRTKYGLATDGTRELYDVLSAGFGESNAIQVLDVAARSAYGGIGELGSAVNATAAIWNSYNLATADTATNTKILEEINGTLNVGIKNGILVMDDYAGTVSRVAATAAEAGVSYKEMIAVTTAATSTTLPMAEAVTGLKSALVNVLKPTDDARKLAAQYGIEMSATAIQAKGLVPFLNDIRAKIEANVGPTGSAAEAMSTLFGSSEAANFVLTVTGSKAETVAASLLQMEDAQRALNDAFEARKANDPALAMQQLAAEMKVLSEKVGADLIPVVKDLLDNYIKPLFDKVKEFNKENPGTLANLAGLGGVLGVISIALGPILFALGSLLTVVGNIKPALAGIKAVLLFLYSKALVPIAAWLAATPLGWLVLAIIGVGVALWALVDDWDAVWDWIYAAVVAVGDWFYEWVIEPIKSAWTGLLTGMVDAAQAMWKKVSEIFNKIVDAAAKAFSWAMDDTGNVQFGARMTGTTAPIPALASGGIVTGPTLALIGEGREAEAVVPLSKLGEMLGGGGSRGDVIVGGITINGYNQDPETLANMVARAIMRRRGA